MPSKRLLLLFVLLLSGCATSRGGADLLGTPEVRTVTVGGVTAGGGNLVVGANTLRYEDQPVVTEDLVSAGKGVVFPALLDAYRAEELIPDEVDAASGSASLSRAEWSGERNGRPISDFLDCGPSSTGRAQADAARVVVAIAAQVSEAGTASSRVALRLSASAYPFDAAGGAARACVTTGELERAILARVQAVVSPARADPDLSAGVAPPGLPAPLPPGPGEEVTLPVSSGDRLRVWVTPDVRVTGVFLQVRQDSLVLGTGRRTAIPLEHIQEIQVKRTRSGALTAGVLVGMAAGVLIATTTDLGIVGQHEVQGEILNPGLGAMAGGLAGALVASMTFGASWVTVPVVRMRAAGRAFDFLAYPPYQ